MTDHKKPGVAFWATVALVAVLVGYPLSFGPACWIVDWADISRYRLSFYLPLIRYSPEFVFRNLERYADIMYRPAPGMPPEIHYHLYFMRHTDTELR